MASVRPLCFRCDRCRRLRALRLLHGARRRRNWATLWRWVCVCDAMERHSTIGLCLTIGQLSTSFDIYFYKPRYFFHFWATVCKTVRPMLSDRCLSCLSVCLSITLVYWVQKVEWTKMKLGMQVRIGPGHTVLDGHPAPLPQRGTAQIFVPYLLWLNGWMD